MNNYILRKEKIGVLLYDIGTGELYYSEEVDDIYNIDKYQLMKRGKNKKLPKDYWDNNKGHVVDNTKYNALLSAPETEFLEMTNMCNLRCKHCFMTQELFKIMSLPIKSCVCL